MSDHEVGSVQPDPDLNTADINNLLVFMERVDLKGREAKTFVGIEMKLQILKQKKEAPSTE